MASNPDDRFAMMELLASLYYDAGKDTRSGPGLQLPDQGEAAHRQDAGLAEPGSSTACCAPGDKKQTVAQIRKLVKIIGDVEKPRATSRPTPTGRPWPRRKDLSERTLSNIAVNWHNEGRKTRDDDTFEYANEVYADYLALFPDNKKSYDLRFFWGELLNDYLRKYPEAAEQYTRWSSHDGKAIDAKARSRASGSPTPPSTRSTPRTRWCAGPSRRAS